MSGLIRRILKALAYVSAAVVVLLAIMLGLFRLFLPRLPEYQEQLKARASAAIGMDVEFAGMDARWGLRGPELSFYDAELIRTDTHARMIAAGEVGIVVSLSELLFEQALVVDTVRVRDSTVEARESADGTWLFQGVPLRELFPGKTLVESITVLGEEITLNVFRRDDLQATRFAVDEVLVQHDTQRTAIDIEAKLPAELGSTVSLAAMQMPGEDGADDETAWTVTLHADGLQLAGVSRLVRDPRRQVSAGQGDVDLSMAFAGTALQNISASLALSAVSLNQAPAFDLAGRFAYNRDADGWLAALDELRVGTANGEWPLSSLRIDARTGADDTVESVELRAAYLKFADAASLAPWLRDKERLLLDRWQPDGAVNNLVMTLGALDGEVPSFAVSAELDRAGFAARGDLPGVRGLSGSLRADGNGGLLAIDADNVTLDLSAWVPEAVAFDRADGTVVWRNSGDRTTVLSDNIVLANAILNSHSSLEISLDGDASPVVDFASDWTLRDIAVAKRFIPRRLMSTRLHQWFQDALLSGRIPSGRTELRGPLDAFPFDGGEGHLLIEAIVEDLEFRYHPDFPRVDVASADVVLDNVRLYTRTNRSTTLGNTTVNAEVDIKDLRRPLLTIDAVSQGTLASLQEFSAQSPIARVFGGHLDKVSVDGKASLALDLEVPIQDPAGFAVRARISTEDGTLSVTGLPAPFTGLAGAVTVERDHIESEGVRGRFLGSPVVIDIADAGAAAPAYRTLVDVRGTATASSLVEELGLPLDGIATGSAAFIAQVQFPRAGYEPAANFAVRIDSDLAGLAIDLPAPLAKPAAEAAPLAGDLVFLPGGQAIQSRGKIGERLRWNLNFAPLDTGWDLDRGMITLGDTPMAEPDVRGLQIRGQVARLDISEWLDLPRSGTVQGGAGGRVRSIDVLASELVFAGQRFANHRLQVDRSARDWLVQVEGDEAAGSIFVPYDFSPANKLVLDMERLVLPGDDESAGAEDDASPASRLDPRRLPAVSAKIGEFGLGERRFGAVTAEFAHRGSGLVAERVLATDPSFRIEGRAEWLADATDPSGSIGRLTVTLTSTDVEATMHRLGYQPGIESDDMQMELDLTWSGGPSRRFLPTIDGNVTVHLGSGQLNEVEPGAGRMFGLLSIAALPRRLSLDFRDVFQKGFGFDEIKGRFRLEDGSAYTCDLSLVGPAADIGITGQADLVAGNYSQTAVVSANLGSTLPVVGALAAGPQVAAALFLFSQIFKKPLKEVGQVYYSMSGSWDSPVVESTDAAAFALSAARAGCLPGETG